MTEKMHWDETARAILLGVMVLYCIGMLVMMALILTGLWQPSCP